ncbi:flagellar protein FliT [Lysinibacillus endophyticus]|uniref:flagellar protein FliT n=1 Tax=Ureibacillus endophyticus TaxID=1978490 RepID=UPI00209FE806|nr:flagellar protein FliT [Lysinibacillus endophyticus]MCP1143754.1 flagellar protein FliT [Lysinibacillus endophyticus]
MDNLQKLLQLSAKLFQFLEDVPKGEKRDEFIQDIDRQLDERGKLVALLKEEGVSLNLQNKAHNMLMDLDKGVRERLTVVMEEVKKDLKNLQTAKKNEKHYSNPYSSVRVMDGMYYDKKK